MKKSIVITLALALLLVLCVSCSSESKTGKVVIDTTKVNKWAASTATPTDIKKAELKLYVDGRRSSDDVYEVIDLNVKNIKKGEVSTRVDVGVYAEADLKVYGGEDPTEFALVRVPGTKDHSDEDSFIVNPGHTLYFEAVTPE